MSSSPFDLLSQINDLIIADSTPADMLQSIYDTGGSSGSAAVDLADGILGGSSSGSSKYYGTDIAGVLGFNPLLTAGCDGRLTLETGVPLSTTDQLAKTIVYFTPYKGNRIALYSGTTWNNLTFTEKHIDITEAQTGTTTNGNKIISGLTDTSQLIAGMAITGTNVGAASVIATVDSLTQVTGTVNSTGSATNTITFKLPISLPYDIFAYNNAGTVKLELCAWTNTTTRATALVTQDGVLVKSGVTTRRYLGTIFTSAAGQTADGVYTRFLYSFYNQTIHPVLGLGNHASYFTYTSVTITEYTNALRGQFCLGLPTLEVFAYGGSYVLCTGGNINAMLTLNGGFQLLIIVASSAVLYTLNRPCLISAGYNFISWYCNVSGGTGYVYCYSGTYATGILNLFM